MHFCQRRWDYKCYKCAGFRYGKGEIMGKFAVKIERVITIALILSMMLILIPGVSVQAKAKKCNHKSVTWITTSKSSCNAILREIRHEKRIVNRIVEEERSLNKEQRISKTERTEIRHRR